MDGKNQKAKYLDCNHIWGYSLIDHDYMEGRTYRYCSCIKCGLSQIPFYKMDNGYYLNEEEQIMYDYLMQNDITEVVPTITKICDYKKIKILYESMKKKQPTLEDEKVIEYINKELETEEKIKQRIRK